MADSVAPRSADRRPRAKRFTGGIIGGVLGLVLLVGLGGFLWRRKNLRHRATVHARVAVVDTGNDPTMVYTVHHPFNYPQEAPPVPEKTQRELALGAAREGNGSRNLDSRLATGGIGGASNTETAANGNVDNASDRPVSPEVLRLRYDLDSLRRIVVQAFQPNDRTEPPPEYNEEPRP